MPNKIVCEEMSEAHLFKRLNMNETVCNATKKAFVEILREINFNL